MLNAIRKWLNGRADLKYERMPPLPAHQNAPDDLYDMMPNDLAALAKAGDGKAAYVLGDIFDQGDRDRPRNFKAALGWYMRAAELGDGDALNNLGSMSQHGDGLPKDMIAARDYYERAVAVGNPVAMGNLGKFYQNGDAGLPKDGNKARTLMTKGAELGDTNSMLSIGHDWDNGVSGPPNPRMALYWYRMAAKSGHQSGYFNLGQCYRLGDIVPRDYAKANELYEHARLRGSASATYCLGLLYWNGLGCEKSPAKALGYFREAEEAGDTDAPEAIRILLKKHPGLQPEEDI